VLLPGQRARSLVERIGRGRGERGERQQHARREPRPQARAVTGGERPGEGDAGHRRVHAVAAQTAQLLGILQTIDTIQDRINNPLQSVLGFAELLGDASATGSEDVRFFAERVGDAARRVADVVGKLRRVRRPATQKWSFGETLDLEAAVGVAPERRTHPRSISVMLARIPGSREGRWYYVEDIGRGGCAVSSMDPLALPDEVEVELADPESGETYWCRAQRIWHDASGAYVGLHFTALDPRLAERLRPEEE
jgi:hypothetical protein